MSSTAYSVRSRVWSRRQLEREKEREKREEHPLCGGLRSFLLRVVAVHLSRCLFCFLFSPFFLFHVYFPHESGRIGEGREGGTGRQTCSSSPPTRRQRARRSPGDRRPRRLVLAATRASAAGRFSSARQRNSCRGDVWRRCPLSPSISPVLRVSGKRWWLRSWGSLWSARWRETGRRAAP